MCLPPKQKAERTKPIASYHGSSIQSVEITMPVILVDERMIINWPGRVEMENENDHELGQTTTVSQNTSPIERSKLLIYLMCFT